MIHEDTGEIELGLHVRVGPSFTEPQFLSSPLARLSRTLADPEGSAYRLERQLLSGRQFRVILRFRRGKLAVVELFQVGAVSKASWDDWSEAEELERKIDHDAWLASLFGPPPYAFPWGQIVSEHDPRGGYSSIFVRYGQRAG